MMRLKRPGHLMKLEVYIKKNTMLYWSIVRIRDSSTTLSCWYEIYATQGHLV